MRLGRRDEIVVEEKLRFEGQLAAHSGLAEHVIGVQADKFHIGARFLEFVVERLGLSDRDLLVVRPMNDKEGSVGFRDVSERRGVAPDFRVIRIARRRRNSRKICLRRCPSGNR